MKVLIALFATCLFSLKSFAAPATHGMVLFGKETIYAYHLPMFHKVHNKQMVLTFDLPQDIKNEIVKLESSGFLTFVPAPFDLEKFIAAPFDLQGDVYAGHFEKDGVLVMSGVTLKSPQILYLKELVKPAGTTSERYKIFGTKNDTYALHLLDSGSAVDQIFKLTTLQGEAPLYNINTQGLMQINSEYSIHSIPGKCPSRLCGEPGYLIGKFKVDSLYFSDDVM